MTAVRMTAAQARQLGIPETGNTTGKRKRSRKTAGGPYHTQCVLCKEEFRTRVGEDRHVEATGHPRYALVLDRPVSPDTEHRGPITRTRGATTEGGTP